MHGVVCPVFSITNFFIISHSLILDSSLNFTEPEQRSRHDWLSTYGQLLLELFFNLLLVKLGIGTFKVEFPFESKTRISTRASSSPAPGWPASSRSTSPSWWSCREHKKKPQDNIVFR